MNIDELVSELKKMKYQIATLAYTVDHNKYPVESLVLEMDWDSSQLNKAHDIFEKYYNMLDAGTEVNWRAFEMELRDQFDIGYQTVKSIILAFYKNDQWMEVCKGYAMSFEPATPVEFHSITRQQERSL